LARATQIARSGATQATRPTPGVVNHIGGYLHVGIDQHESLRSGTTEDWQPETLAL